MKPVFVDTNVLVYNRDASEREKQPQASAWLTHLWQARLGRVSHQVLHEYYVTVTRKLSPGLPRSIAREDVRELALWDPLALDMHVVETAWTLEEQTNLGWWDALIVAAAQVAGCGVLLTEDLQDGQRFGEVEVVDPFGRDPGEVLG